MESEFLQKVRDYFTTEFKQQIALSLDEETPAIDKALSAIIPAGMSAMIHRAENADNRGTSIYNLAQGAANYFPASPDLAKLHNEEEGARVSSDVLDGHENAITDAVAKFAGIKRQSAGSLIMLSIPVLMGSLGIYANKEQLDENGVHQFLLSQRENVNSLAPSGFRPALAVFDHGHRPREEREVTAAIQTDSPPRTNRGWILPIILAILAVLLLIYFSRGCNPPPEAGGAFIIPSFLTFIRV